MISKLLEVSLDDGYGEATARLAAEHGITVYDSSYLAIGELQKLRVFTADERLLEKVEDLGFVYHVREY